MTTVLLPSSSRESRHAPSPQAEPPRPFVGLHRLLPWLVAAAAGCLAVLLFSRYLGAHRQLWSDPVHDRHAHLLSGLSLATDVREGHLRRLVSDLDNFRTW